MGSLHLEAMAPLALQAILEVQGFPGTMCILETQVAALGPTLTEAPGATKAMEGHST